MDNNFIPNDYGWIYTPFDESDNREEFFSKDLQKGQVVWLFNQVYSAYLKLWQENKKLKEEIACKKNTSGSEEIEPADSSMLFTEKMANEINKLIDKRVSEMLSLDDDCVQYGGEYATLRYGNDELGSICLKGYDD